MNRFIRSARFKIAVGVVSTFVAMVAVFFAVLFPRVRHRLISMEEQHVAIAAASLASEIGSTLGAALQQLESAAELETIRQLDPRRMDGLLETLESTSPFFRHFTVLDDLGTIVSRPAIPEHKGESRADRPYYQAVAETGLPFFGEPRISSRNNLSLNVAVRINASDGGFGVLMGSLGLADRNPRLYESVLDPDVPEGWEVVLTSADGLVLAHSAVPVEAERGLSGVDASTHPTRERQPTPSGVVRYDIDGESYVGASARVAPSGWQAVVQVPEATLLAPVSAVTKGLLATVTLTALGVLLSGLLFTGRLTVRMTRLTTALNRYAARGTSPPVPIRGNDEIADALRAFNRMVAERERVGQELQEREDQLRQAGRLEAIGRLAGGVAHDFNNLLTVMLGHTQLLLSEHRDDENTTRGLQQITDAAKRGADLIRRLLAFSRRQFVEPERLDVGTLVRQAEQLIGRLIGDDVVLDVRVPEHSTWILADRVQLEQIIMNLAVNARDAMPEGGRLSIRVEDRAPVAAVGSAKSQWTVVLSVEDTGEGIPEDVQEKIFDPFFTTKEPGKGTGLGLSMAFGAISQMGGEISVDSAPDKGTRFEIRFPYAEDDTIEVGECVETVRQIMPNASGTVLVAEDEDGVRALTVRYLEEQGYNVLSAGTPTQALELARQFNARIDVLVTDVVMPQMTGLELADRLSAREPHMRVVFISGYPDRALMHYGVDSSRLSVLAKPFDRGELLERVGGAESWLRESVFDVDRAEAIQPGG